MAQARAVFDTAEAATDLVVQLHDRDVAFSVVRRQNTDRLDCFATTMLIVVV